MDRIAADVVSIHHALGAEGDGGIAGKRNSVQVTCNCLPMEIVEDVLSYLPAPTIRTVAQVDRRWHAASIRPLRSCCVRADLAKPRDPPRESWWTLQASHERIERHWSQNPLSRGPCYVFAPATAVFDAQFSEAAITICPGGAYLQGTESAYVELPPVGSTSIPRITRLRDGTRGLSNGGCIRWDYKRAEVFPGPFSKTPSSTALMDDDLWSLYCVGELLLTGHDDCVSVRSLNSFQVECSIQTGSRITSVAASAGGSIILARSHFGKAWLWDRRSQRTIWVGRSDNVLLDHRRSQVIVIVDRRLTRYSFAGRRVMRRRLPKHQTFAFDQLSGRALCLDTSGNAFVVDTLTKERYVGAKISLPQPFSAGSNSDELFATAEIDSLQLSDNGRWIVGLTSSAEVMLWDLEGARKSHSEIERSSVAGAN